jgi:rhomboid protease GluP
MSTTDHLATSDSSAPARSVSPASSDAGTATAAPVVTAGILVVMGLVFSAELLFGVEPWRGALRPGVTTLLAFGGLQHPLLVGQGQWYRLFSAPLLHLDATHVLINGLVLWYGGRALEAMIGRSWFALIFILGGIVGALASLGGNAHNVVSVGASGAIMAVLAATYLLAFHYEAGAHRSAAQSSAMRLLIPSLIPLGLSLGGNVIDYHAHFGGAAAGALMGAALLAIWPVRATTPALSRLAALIVALGLSATVYSAVAGAGTYHVYNMTRSLIPAAELPKDTATVLAKAPELLKQYPADPRVHLYQAVALVQAKDLAGAEQEMRAGLANEDVLRLLFAPGLKTHLQSYLALILIDDRRKDEAVTFARAGCLDTKATLHGALVKAGLCETPRS